MKKTNIGWIDLLRIAACFAVVFAHCCDSFVARFDADRDSFLTGVYIGSLFRPCVPLFVMITGVLLFPIGTDYTLKRFYRKRIGRIIPPLVFWSLALPLLFFAYYNYVNPNTHNPLISAENYTSGTLIGKLYTFVLNFNFDTTPLWYLYMLAGLYLIMPILNSWLVQASRDDVKTVLYLWGVSLFLPYIKMLAPLLGYQGNYGNMDILGVCDWNVYGTFYYFSGFIGYLILAYYLTKYPLQWSLKKTSGIAIPLFLAGYAVTAYGYVLTQNHFPGNYAYLEIVWYFSGINVFMMTFSVFIVMQKIRVPALPWLSRLAALTFGVYLCHFVFVFICYDWFDIPALPYAVRIVFMACTAFLISLIAVWGMDRLKMTRRFIR